MAIFSDRCVHGRGMVADASASGRTPQLSGSTLKATLTHRRAAEFHRSIPLHNCRDNVQPSLQQRIPRHNGHSFRTCISARRPLLHCGCAKFIPSPIVHRQFRVVMLTAPIELPDFGFGGCALPQWYIRGCAVRVWDVHVTLRVALSCACSDNYRMSWGRV